MYNKDGIWSIIWNIFCCACVGVSMLFGKVHCMTVPRAQVYESPLYQSPHTIAGVSCFRIVDVYPYVRGPDERRRERESAEADGS